VYWKTIESVPKDGTVVDLWHEEFGRFTDMYWGKPNHCCGEAGMYCDSDWHRKPEGWVFSVADEVISADSEGYTHYMFLPAPPNPIA